MHVAIREEAAPLVPRAHPWPCGVERGGNVGAIDQEVGRLQQLVGTLGRAGTALVIERVPRERHDADPRRLHLACKNRQPAGLLKRLTTQESGSLNVGSKCLADKLQRVNFSAANGGPQVRVEATGAPNGAALRPPRNGAGGEG